MKKFRATSDTGMAFFCDGGSDVRVKDSGVAFIIESAQLVPFPEHVFLEWVSSDIDWDYLIQAPTRDVPLVGEHLYVFGPERFVISSRIVSVEEYT